MIPLVQNFMTVIVANGAFPQHPVPLTFLHKASEIIACDGATDSLINFGKEPDYIVGDLDSLSDKIKQKYAHILHYNPDQETNDLTKAVHFCLANGWNEITIIGATGKREDHSLGNISLLAEYSNNANIQLLTDYGSFIAIDKSSLFESYEGEQVSLFSLHPDTLLTSKYLKYSLDKRSLSSWWQGTLNEALTNTFEIEIDKGKILVFRQYKP